MRFIDLWDLCGHPYGTLSTVGALYAYVVQAFCIHICIDVLVYGELRIHRYPLG